LWLFTVLALVGLDVLLAPPVGAVSVERLPAGRVRAGHETTSAVTVENTGRRPASLLVRDAWQPTAGASGNRHRLRLRSGDRAVISTPLRPSRRGELAALGVTVRSLGPLGLAARQRTLPAPGGLRVIPPFESRKHLPSRLARLRDLDGRSAVRVRGQGTEFDSLREYVVGDDPRSIDWRATARRADVVVRTWRPERDRHVVLVLDTGRTSAARVAGAPRLETTLDAALLMTALARHAGDRVTLLAHDVRLRAAVDAGRGANALATVVSATAGLQPALVETDMPAVVTQVLRRVRQRSLVVLLTALDPAPVEEGLLPAIASLVRRHAVLVASIADPAVDAMAAGRGDAEAVYAAAAAEATRTERADIAAALRRRGVDVLDAPPATFASKLADAYLEMKASGRL